VSGWRAFDGVYSKRIKACTGVNVLEAQHSQLSHDTQVALADRVTR
jgi:hypothetical protein